MEKNNMLFAANKQLQQKLKDTRILSTTIVPAEEYILGVDGIGFFALRDIGAIKAKQKAGKTTLLKVCIAALLLGQKFRVKSFLDNPKIIVFDTEQNCADTKLILEDVAQMTGLDPKIIDSQVVLHSLRRCNREQLMPLLRADIELEKPNVVFIDGIVEFIDSFNNEAESKQLIHELLVLCDEYDCAIVCVLHQNKAEEDRNMRGHLGTMLAQKAGTVLECKKDNGVITVNCSDSRHAEAPTWNIMYDEEGHIVDADERYKKLLEERKLQRENVRKKASEKEKKERLQKCLCIIRDYGCSITRKELTEALTAELHRDRTTVSSYISQWLMDKYIIEDKGMIQAAENMCQPF